jgi:phage-related protein
MSSSSLGNVVIAIKAVDEASGIMGKIQASMGLLGGALQNLGGGFASVGTVVQGFAAGGVAGAAIGALGEVAKGLQDCIKEATSSEAVFASLGAAVTRSGTAWDTVSEATKNTLLAMQKTTTYSDEELAAALERLMTFGLSYDDAMKALGTTLDFASAKHMDLESAATLVGKAMDGNTAILKRYGVDLATSKDAAAALDAAHKTAAQSIKALGDGVGVWVTQVTAAIGADSQFETGLSGAKDKAQYLIDQFKAGNIDLPQFTTAMQSLGVQLDEAKMKGGSAEEVLSKLNEQFGGAAQAQAETYAGIQERLKNATEEVGEKIGMIFLPALASLTEGMLPVVDWLGKGVDATSAWLTEVGKMPEVQGIMAAVNEAFSGLGKYLEGVWKFIVDNFGPALKELFDAFKDLYDAVSPIFDALKELAGAFGDTSGMDIFKGMLMVLVIDIRAIAGIIKEVAPYIKAFAQAFRDAADFVTPILTQIVAAIRAFTDDLRSVFQAFYTWLVGGSLWTDLWDRVADITRNAGTLLGSIVTGMFSILSGLFTVGVDLVGTILKTGFSLTFATVQTIVSGAVDVLKYLIGTFQETIHGAMRDWSDLVSVISTSIPPMKEMISEFWTWMKDYWKVAINEIVTVTSAGIGAMETDWTAFIGFMSQGLGQLQGILGTATASVTSTISTMQTTTSTAVSQIQATLSGAWNAITTGAQGLWNALVGHSIWTDMLDEMQAQTASALGNIVGDFQGAFGDVALSVPTMPSQAGPSRGSEASAPLISQLPQNITIPVQVQVDGATVARTVTTRLVQQISARRSMR